MAHRLNAVLAIKSDPNPNLHPLVGGYCSDIKKKYGLSKSDYLALVQAQAGCCAICGGYDKGKRLAVDHCHETGKARGLLCQACNRSLGQMGNSAVRLRLAAAYIEGWRLKR